MKNEYLSETFIRSCFSEIECLVQNLLDPVLPDIDTLADTVKSILSKDLGKTNMFTPFKSSTSSTLKAQNINFVSKARVSK